MSGLKTALTMSGIEDLSENDIPTLYNMCKKQRFMHPPKACIHIPSDVRNLLKRVYDGSNVKVSDRKTLWGWLDKLYKQLLS
ncbi:hypothetical protein [Clostridium sp.]|uniref:hypothetical protein n=1 Tax=Clostridium sp. TaxID=1506 RepID=UPI00258D85C2|nr:hypothetical protein [Clostridium sp.]